MRPKQTQCYMGHPYTPENIRLGISRCKGVVYQTRKCRICERRNQQLRRIGR